MWCSGSKLGERAGRCSIWTSRTQEANCLGLPGKGIPQWSDGFEVPPHGGYRIERNVLSEDVACGVARQEGQLQVRHAGCAVHRRGNRVPQAVQGHAGFQAMQR
jgi:hypothetical protein